MEYLGSFSFNFVVAALTARYNNHQNALLAKSKFDNNLQKLDEPLVDVFVRNGMGYIWVRLIMIIIKVLLCKSCLIMPSQAFLYANGVKK